MRLWSAIVMIVDKIHDCTVMLPMVPPIIGPPPPDHPYRPQAPPRVGRGLGTGTRLIRDYTLSF